MQITVLGCSAGLGAPRRTTSLLLNEHTLIDAGSGVGDLAPEQLLAINQVLLTHAHLDHCCLLPMLTDAGAGKRAAPLNVYALPETLADLQAHMFNNRLWPDYTAIPNPAQPYLRLQPLLAGQTLQLEELSVTPLPVRHSVPAQGYLLRDGGAAFAFSGDTALHLPFWQALAAEPLLRQVMVELTYPDARRAEASRFGHLCPSDLAEGVSLLPAGVEILISHLEPGEEVRVMSEIRALLPDRRLTQLVSGQQLMC